MNREQLNILHRYWRICIDRANSYYFHENGREGRKWADKADIIANIYFHYDRRLYRKVKNYKNLIQNYDKRLHRKIKYAYKPRKES